MRLFEEQSDTFKCEFCCYVENKSSIFSVNIILQKLVWEGIIKWRNNCWYKVVTLDTFQLFSVNISVPFGAKVK